MHAGYYLLSFNKDCAKYVKVVMNANDSRTSTLSHNRAYALYPIFPLTILHGEVDILGHVLSQILSRYN